MDQLNANGRELQAGLLTYERRRKARARQRVETAHVIGVGGTLTSAYEQLRNAAEYTEEHLLLQKAIARYFRRLYILHNEEDIEASGNELVVELTLSGYLENDSVSTKDIETITRLAKSYYQAYTSIEKAHPLPTDKVSRWVVDVLAVRVEKILGDHTKDMLFAEFAYQHLLKMYDKKSLFGAKKLPEYPVLLYVAVLRALLHADDALIRAILLERYNQTPDNFDSYTRVNGQIDELFAMQEAKKVYNHVNRQGAPYRILRRTLDEYKAAQHLDDKPLFMGMYMQCIEQEYRRAHRRINRAIIKSVIFLFITKVVIGLAVEIPYDKLAYGYVHMLPLIINLLLPPLFMLLLRATLVLPGNANTSALVGRGMTLLYEKEKSVSLRRRTLRDAQNQQILRMSYGVFAFIVIMLVVVGLLALSFTWVHIVIFLVFMSTASFLGFRLSRIVRELEVVDADQSALATLRDFVYFPFVRVGQWLNQTYSQVNIVGTILDMAIELPMKTILRLIRQWSRFINERKDEL